MEIELDRLGSQISRAFDGEIPLSRVSPLDFRTISNAILASSSVSNSSRGIRKTILVLNTKHYA